MYSLIFLLYAASGGELDPKRLKLPEKKKELCYRERNREERMKYYRVLRELIKIYGSEGIVFIEE